jgi:hypothetical protein
VKCAFWLLGLLACTGAVLSAQVQAPAGISGRVTDETGSALPGARVTIVSSAPLVSREATTNGQGDFAFSPLPAGRYSITAELAGFAMAQPLVVVLVAGESRTVAVEMRVAGVKESVLVGASSAAAPATPSVVTVTPRAVSTVAGAAENIYRVLHTLPGVAAVNEFDSRLTVRGGGPDQNLTVMDGVEIHNPFRLFGLTSAFNPETVQSFELTAGGFSARYGDRLSSILTIDNRDGDATHRATGSTTLALTDANVVAEGRLPGTTRGSWLVTGRRTYYDLVAEKFVDADLPSFADLQGKLVWQLPRNGRLTLFGLRSRENTDASIEGDDGGHAALRTNALNDLAALTFSFPAGSRVSSRTVASWYLNRDLIDFDAEFRTGTVRSNSAFDEEPGEEIVFTRRVSIRDIAIRQDTAIRLGRAHTLDAGFDTHMLSTSWGWRIGGERNPAAANGSSVLGGAGLPSLLDSVRDSWRAGAWLTDRWTLTPALRLESGVRVDRTKLTRPATFSPRMSLVADLSPRTRLRLSGGAFTQSPGYEKLLQSDYFVDLTSADAIDLRTQRARHAVIGLEQTLAPGLIARAEGYYKNFTDVVIGRLETSAETAARVATYDFPASLSSNVPRDPIVLGLPSNGANGRGYGVELYVARQPSLSTFSPGSPGRKLTGWMSYTWSRADQTAYGRTFAADYDRRHAFTLVANMRLNAVVDLAATMRAQSGFPYSPPVGVRVASEADVADIDRDGNRTELIPARNGGLLGWTLDAGGVANLNSGRLPVFSRLDARITFRPRWMNSRWQFYVDVINVLNKDNATGYDARLEYDPGSDRPRIVNERQGSLPRLPSLGIRFRF